MNRRRRNSLLTLLTLATGAVGIALYAQNAGFTQSWRHIIEAEFAKRGYQAEVGKLTLGPIQGLVAEDVRIFLERSRRTEYATIDQVILDVDLGRVLEKELTLNSIDFKQADISLPVDPSDPDSQRLRISNFSARAVMSEQDIEIVHASAVIHGLPVTLKGTLHRPPLEVDQDSSEKTKTEIRTERRAQLQRITERLRVFAAVLAQLEQFDFSPAERGQGIELKVSGDLADTDTMNASCEINLGPFRRDTLEFEQMRALFEFNGERLSLRELLLRDAEGELRLNADWPIASGIIHFKAESTIDLPHILGELTKQPAYGEVVFFSPPQLQFEGDWLLDAARIAAADELDSQSPAPLPTSAEAPLPLRGVGSFSCDRFTTRGAVFDSFTTDFSVADDQAYFRNLRLDHQSGIAQANLLFDANEGFQYQAELKFDPTALLPFVSEEHLRRHLADWSFSGESTVYIGAEGSGPTLDRSDWSHNGVIDLRRCRLNGVDLQRFEADFETAGINHTFTNLRLQGAGGSLVGQRVIADLEASTIEVDALVSDLELSSLARLVDPSLAKQLAEVKFATPPQLTFNGTADIRTNEQAEERPRHHDLKIAFTADGEAEFKLFGHRTVLGQPRGSVHLQGTGLEIETLRANAFGGTVDLGLSLNRWSSAPAPPTGKGSFTLAHDRMFDAALLRPLAEQLRKNLNGADEILTTPAEASVSFTFDGAELVSENARVINTKSIELIGSVSANLRDLSVSGECTARATAPPEPPGAAPEPSLPFKLKGSIDEPIWESVD